MFHLSFFKMLFLIGIGFVFGKIYRHNVMIRIRYEEQRLERCIRELDKKKALLMYHLHNAKNYHTVAHWACCEQSMSEIKMSHVITLTTGLSCEI